MLFIQGVLRKFSNNVKRSCSAEFYVLEHVKSCYTPVAIRKSRSKKKKIITVLSSREELCSLSYRKQKQLRDTLNSAHLKLYLKNLRSNSRMKFCFVHHGNDQLTMYKPAPTI